MHNDCGVVWKGFSKGKLVPHFLKHGAEFGEISQIQYLKLAKSFAGESGAHIQKQTVGKFLVKFNTNIQDGFIGRMDLREIRTFYRTNPAQTIMAFATTFNPFGPKMTLNVPAMFGAVGKGVLPQATFRMTEDLAPLSASQFSKLFKGTTIARATPATRGLLNRYLNKGLNGLNSVGLYRTV